MHVSGQAMRRSCAPYTMTIMPIAVHVCVCELCVDMELQVQILDRGSMSRNHLEGTHQVKAPHLYFVSNGSSIISRMRTPSVRYLIRVTPYGG